MRGYKKVWSVFDPERTGHIQPKDVGLFLHVRPSQLLRLAAVPS